MNKTETIAALQKLLLDEPYFTYSEAEAMKTAIELLKGDKMTDKEFFKKIDAESEFVPDDEMTMEEIQNYMQSIDRARQEGVEMAVEVLSELMICDSCPISNKCGYGVRCVDVLIKHVKENGRYDKLFRQGTR